MTDRTLILDRLFTNAERFMEELTRKHGGVFSNLQLLRRVAQDQQQAYIDLLYSFRDTPNRSPFNAAHQEIGKRIYNAAIRAGYVRAEEHDGDGLDVFDNPTDEKFYRRKSR